MTMTTANAPGAVRRHRMLVGDAWVDAVGGETIESRNPFDGSVFAEVPAGGRPDAAAAIAAAAAAQPEWAATAPGVKQRLFLRAADLLEERADDVAEALALETGAGRAFALYQIGWSVSQLRHASGWVYRPSGEMLRTEHPHTMSTAERRPLGVVASFTPWNGAHVLAWRAVIAPLAAGNTVVLKPSEEAPVTAGLLVAEIMRDAGFPAGTVNVVTHAGPAAAEVAEEFYVNPAVRCLYFTGSAGTARTIGSRAGGALKRSVLELGGYNNIVVLDDADLDRAARIVAFSAFFHQGQICMNARRVLVQSSVHDAFVARLAAVAESLAVGDPSDPATIVGPLITERALDQVTTRVASVVAAGANVVTGGTSDGRLYRPTVLTNVPDDHDISCEETFGPVVVVRPVQDEEEAVGLVNASRYGLSFSVLTGDTGRGIAVAQRIDCGAVHVNTPTINDEAHAPNGGMKDSGWGRSGVDALDDFTEIRWVTVDMGTRELPL
ncbi:MULTISPECIES: aldehyde dehydrogenase family protein [unclassified Amycolatopsis]|uniref:aldehyde dehydrogenase family protein n=1 Tax=unclassified Amycolatopsis TaxID=2618356 RepID=UPI001C6A42F5|nr:aldehyde dehydrogenase family protein [Amycolatopsis sp. DSM 110486]QYN20221.1 aldehyde dehydrogenase family protein [Amycolatopsis sp. DSM 110486]